jgi:nucleoside-diphosphate-sugar epimerase
MNILLTGSTGFLGTIIIKELNSNNKIFTLSRTNSDYNFDLSNKIPLFKDTFDLVVHCAGKAHQVPQNEIDIKSFFNTNVNGTLNLLKGFTLNNLPKYFVLISSVAVYGIKNGELINEDSPLLANDPYGKSKIEAEKIVLNWCKENNVIFTILRLPLIIGDNPKGNLSSMIKAINKGYYFNIDSGKSRKSIVSALNVANIIPKVATIGGIYNLTDGYNPTVSELSHYYLNFSSKKRKIPDIPYWLAKLISIIGDILGDKFPINSEKLTKITNNLTFDDSKARNVLHWNPESIFNPK